MTDPSPHDTNLRIAAGYDAVPYDPAPDGALDIDRVLGLAAVYGATASAGDVLDLGCGAGGLLAHVAPRASGRLVGADLSAQACRLARGKLAAFAPRAQILHADLLDLTADKLGKFDLIYCIGTLFIVPPEVRIHILTLIAQCLKPGGAAVLGYYAGALDRLRAGLHRTLCAVIPPGTPPADAVARARAHLKQIEAALPPGDRLPREALRQTAALPDFALYHEALNHAFEALDTSALEQSLAPHGIGFASYLGPAPFLALPASRERARAADAMDRAFGSYRHAVFVRCPPTPPDLRRDTIRWSSLLRRAAPGDGIRPVTFHTPDGQPVGVRGPVTVGLLAALEEGPLTWREAFARGQHIAAAAGHASAPGQEETSLAGFTGLFSHGFAVPLFAG